MATDPPIPFRWSEDPYERSPLPSTGEPSHFVETPIPRAQPTGPYSPIQSISPIPPSSNDTTIRSINTVASGILYPSSSQTSIPSSLLRSGRVAPLDPMTLLEIQTLAPSLTADKIRMICHTVSCTPSTLLQILKKIDAYEKMASPTENPSFKVYKDPILNQTDPELNNNPSLRAVFNDVEERSLIRIKGEWFILVKEKGPQTNLKVRGGFNKATLGINPQTGELKVVRTGLFIEDPLSSADSEKEIKMTESINILVDQIEAEKKETPPFLKTDTLIYYGKIPTGRTHFVRKYNLKPDLSVKDSQNSPLYKKVLNMTPYCEKGNVQNLLDFSKLTLEQKWKAMRTIAFAVEILDKNGIVHGDLKPANMVLNDKGEFYIIDFGLSNKKENFVQRGQGTERYKPVFDSLMSEGASAPFDQSAFDIFSLGVSLSEFYFDDKILELNIRYTSQPKTVESSQLYQEELEEIIENYKTKNKELAELISLCLDIEPYTRNGPIDGKSRAQYVREKLESITPIF